MLFCQDKEIGVEAMERKRIEYIDWLRIISAIQKIHGQYTCGKTSKINQ